jgi:hypothetical protein
MLSYSSLRVIGSLQFLSKNPRFGNLSVMLLQSSIWYLWRRKIGAMKRCLVSRRF